MRKVLALMPHPDDMELLCAGTLIRLASAGWEIHVMTMTPGDKGSDKLTPTEIAEVRRGEAEQGAAAIGAEYRCLEFRDCEILFDNSSRRKIAAVIRELAPQIVITTPPIDYMEDHEVTSRLVRDACFNATLRNYTPEAGGPVPFPHLYYTLPLGGTDSSGEPARLSCTIDISDVMEQKAAALACHRSQREFLDTQQGLVDCVDTMRRWAVEEGARIGVPFAESFWQHSGHPFPSDDILRHLLEEG